MTVGLMCGWLVVFALLGSGYRDSARFWQPRGQISYYPMKLHLALSALLRIQNPKTRGRVARHQAARIDPAGIVFLVHAVFKDYSFDQPLCSISACTLRKRFTAILKFLELPILPRLQVAAPMSWQAYVLEVPLSYLALRRTRN